MQRALRNMLMTENDTEKLDYELITTLLENITTPAQLHQFTRAEGKNNNSLTRVVVTRQCLLPLVLSRVLLLWNFDNLWHLLAVHDHVLHLCVSLVTCIRNYLFDQNVLQSFPVS